MTTPITPAQIAELRRLLSEATPGPWEPDVVWDRQHWSGIGPEHEGPDHEGAALDAAEADAALIAAAVNALGPLLDRLDALELTVATARASIDETCAPSPDSSCPGCRALAALGV